MGIFWLKIFVVTTLSNFITCTEEVKMVIRVARHGARGPSKMNKLGLEWKGLYEDFDFNELIPVGYHQQYLSGLELSFRYRNLFSSKLEPDEYYLASTEKYRSYNSLFAHFLAFKSTVFPQDRKSGSKSSSGNPIGINLPVIHTVPGDSDILLRPGAYSKCKTFKKRAVANKKKLLKELSKSREVQEFSIRL